MTVNLPTGTVTFFFTDIEGSTQLWEQYPDAMKAALARHDALLHQAIETHNGHVFKTVGDAFYAAFASARDAVSAALDAQRAIQAESWGETPIKVRMAIHAGAVETRNNDYFGPTLNRVARLMSAGHGGQILLSASAHEMVQFGLPAEAELRDMGERGLKDLVLPEHIYQLTATGLQTDFPPLKTLEAFRANLPVQLTSFIGREKEISTVKRLIAEHRLTTLTGSGGTGKTRLSLQVAADLLDFFPDGVWFIELAPLADPDLVPQTVLTTLGLREETGWSALETLTHYLQSKKVLLILDNCEHLVETAAQFAQSLLHACLNLRLLVSSREALGIPGEKAWHVASLSTPKPDLPQSAETITQYEAVRLFVDRAKTVSSAFAITSANVSAVAQICSRLDGIPLAIELAAARVKMLKAEQIAERLDDRFRLLTGGSRTALPRQQTLRALIDWSYDLLLETERSLLRRLSVFAGGWTLEAAETVCSTKDESGKTLAPHAHLPWRAVPGSAGVKDEGSSKERFLHPFDVLDLLTQLVNKSLVVVDAADESPETRYRLLETVRQYALERLAEAGEGMDVRDRHLQYFLGLAERADIGLNGPQVVEWMRRLEIELDNIRAAFEWSLNRSPELGLQLANALFGFWSGSGYARDGYNWLTKFLNHSNTQSRTLGRARALSHLGFFLTFGDFGQNARPILEESLALSRELKDKSGLASSLLHLGMFIFQRDAQDYGKKLVIESLEIYRELNDKARTAWVLTYLGSTADITDRELVYAYFNEALGICREIGNVSGIARILSDLGDMAIKYGDYHAASLWLEESLAIRRQLGKSNLIWTLIHSTELAARTGNDLQARAYYEESLSLINQAVGGLWNTYWFFVKLGYVTMWQGNLGNAKDMFEQSMRHFKEIGEKIDTIYTAEGLASLALRLGKFERGVRLFGWADVAREVTGSPRPPVQQADVDRDLAALRAQLDDTTFAAAQAEGRAMSMDEAITYALESTHPSIRPVGQSGQDD